MFGLTLSISGEQVYLLDILGKNGPRELTAGDQGATHTPVFSRSGTKVAWTELDLDGYESDRAKVVIYDLGKDVRYTLTQSWDRSPDTLSFGSDDEMLYLTAGEDAHVKLWRLALPPTPEKSSKTPDFPKGYNATPEALTTIHAVSAPQPLSNGDVLFTQSSFTSPNDVFVLRASDSSPSGKIEKITSFSEKQLRGKDLDEGESFWFEGAEGKRVHGWVLKPKGWRKGSEKSVPAVLLIHGGPQGVWADQWSTRWNPNGEYPSFLKVRCPGKAHFAQFSRSRATSLSPLTRQALQRLVRVRIPLQ